MDKKESPKPLTDKQTLFLDFLFGEAEGDLKRARELAGYSPGTKMSEIVGPLSDIIVEMTTKHLALNAPRAAMELVTAMNKSALPGIANKIKAATEVLNRAGVRDRVDNSANLKVDVGGGIVILPAKNTTSNDTTSDDI